MLNNLQTQFFIDNGYIILDQKFTQSELNIPIKLINTALIDPPKTKNDAIFWVKKKTKLQRKKDIISIINNPKIKSVLDQLLSGMKPITHCQIASRFPGENCSENNQIPNNWYESWHIDNYTPKDFERNHIPPDFSCLVGIYLSDNLDEFTGNFTIFPGSHHQIQIFSQQNGGQDYYQQNGLTNIRQSLKLNNPFQIKTDLGSIIICHRMLPHLISAPNTSNKIRTIIWFRITSNTRIGYSDPETFTNIWKEWSIHNPIYPNQYIDQIKEIELVGYGYLEKSDTDYIQLRLKQFNSYPCLFASRITLKLFTTNNNIQIHTNGFISRKNHHKIANDIKNNCKSIIEMAIYINNLDYDKMILNWYPFIKSNNKFQIKTYKLHHIKSKSKTDMMLKWANELAIYGFIIIGKPGFVIIGGDYLDIFVKRFDCFHWSYITEIQLNLDKNDIPTLLHKSSLFDINSNLLAKLSPFI